MINKYCISLEEEDKEKMSLPWYYTFSNNHVTTIALSNLRTVRHYQVDTWHNSPWKLFLKILFWTLSLGQERYRAITSAYYRGALGAILVYDIAKVSSFQNLGKWIAELKQHTDTNLCIIIVGNKSDLKHLRIVETKRGQKFATDHGVLFMETSALDSTNVREAFEDFVMEIYEGVKEREKAKPRKNTLPPPPEQLKDAIQNGLNGSVNLTSEEGEKGKHRKNKLPCCST